MKMKKIIAFLVLTNLFFITPKVKANELSELEEHLKIISRKAWSAKPPIKTMTIHKPEKITIHHSGVNTPSKVDLLDKMKKLQSYSQAAEKMANGKVKEVWADVPYHFVISGTGEIAEGREIIYAGDTNTEYKPEKHILIDVLGNFEEQEPTEAQIVALEELCLYLAKKYHIKAENINGHKFYAETACPGKNLTEVIPKIKRELAFYETK